jgi:hypothetical protein
MAVPSLIEREIHDTGQTRLKSRVTSLKALRDQADEVRIMGSKSELLRTLVAASSLETAAFIVLF